MHEGERERGRESLRRWRHRLWQLGLGERERERDEMDGLSTGNGFDHSFQRQGGGDGGGWMAVERRTPKLVRVRLITRELFDASTFYLHNFWDTEVSSLNLLNTIWSHHWERLNQTTISSLTEN